MSAAPSARPLAIYPSTRSRCLAIPSGPMLDWGSKGSPTRIFWNAERSASTRENHDASASRSRASVPRRPAQREWVLQPPVIPQNSSTSKSSSTIAGDFPPSSSVHRATRSAHRALTRLPAAVDPVKLTLSTSGWRTSNSDTARSAVDDIQDARRKTDGLCSLGQSVKRAWSFRGCLDNDRAPGQ